MSSEECPRPEHPRPDWVRKGRRREVLNGKWKFAFDDNDAGLLEGWWKWTGEATSKDVFDREQ